LTACGKWSKNNKNNINQYDTVIENDFENIDKTYQGGLENCKYWGGRGAPGKLSVSLWASPPLPVYMIPLTRDSMERKMMLRY
jgi:hypothetical protein